MDFHTVKLIAAAEQMGIATRDLSSIYSGQDAVELSWQGQRHIVFDGRSFPYLYLNSLLRVDNKTACKTALQEIQVLVPGALVFFASDPQKEAQIEAFMRQGGQYVAKPEGGTDGDGVGMHMNKLEDVLVHIAQKWRFDYDEWLLEEQVPGGDVRLMAIGGKLVAACMRVPAAVTGDGQRSVQDLVDAHNEKIYQQNPANKLSIDSESRKLMKEQEIKLSTVLEEGREVRLKYISNMGMGGTAIDITEEIHPGYIDLMERTGKHFDLRTFAMDGLSTDYTKPPETHFYALEINGRAQWMHHTFSEVRQHDIATMLLKDLFGMD